jgi:hypothetical protein
MKIPSAILYALLGILIGATLIITTEYIVYEWYGRDYVEQKIKKTVVKKIFRMLFPF